MTRKVPHTFVIIFFLIIAAAILTWIIPGGQYTEETAIVNGVEQTRMVFHYTEHVRQWWQVFASFYNGFVRQARIIVFIMLIGGSFWVINSSKAIDVGIFSFIRFIRRLDHHRIFRIMRVESLVLAVIWIIFSVFGAVFGMSEETLAFIVVLVPLAITMGYDSITGVSVVYITAGVGFAGAVLNPFTIGIAQGIAELPLFSGLEYRAFCWIVLNAAGLIFLLRYAARIRKDPFSSPVHALDEHWRQHHAIQNGDIPRLKTKRAWIVHGFISLVLIVFSIQHAFTTVAINEAASVQLPLIPLLSFAFIISGIFMLRRSVHFYLLQMLLFTILFLIVGVMGYEWYIMEIATLFFSMGIFAGLCMQKSPDALVRLFLEGVRDILPAALIVGMAGGIIIILEDGQVIDTILYGLSESMRGMGRIATVGIMYLMQCCINLIVVSGSAQAALTMPILAPFSDLVGISRQTTVMVFQFGDGFTNMITPASAVLMGVLGIARIPYEKWIRWVIPLVILLILLGFILLIPTVMLEIKGF